MSIDEIVKWFRADRNPSMSKDEAVLMLHTMHPRTHFVKTLTLGARMLDLGAGNGGLEVLRRWPPPSRTDLKMYAYAPQKGAHFDLYDGYEVGNWELSRPVFPGVDFDAVFSSHFVQRLPEISVFVEWIARRLSSGGRLYLEWPTLFSSLLPTRLDLEKEGISLSIANFRDDDGNKVVHDRSRIADALTKAGFFLENHGFVSLPFIEEEILAHTKLGLNDPYALQAAFWSKTRWTQYVVAVRKR